MTYHEVRIAADTAIGRRALIAGIGGLAAGAALSSRSANAGPLTPPPGPIAPADSNADDWNAWREYRIGWSSQEVCST